jgi:hypothetical protein
MTRVRVSEGQKEVELMNQSAQGYKTYIPTPDELKFIEEVRLQVDDQAANAAYCVIYRRMTSFGANLPNGMESVIREIARRCDVDLPC